MSTTPVDWRTRRTLLLTAAIVLPSAVIALVLGAYAVAFGRWVRPTSDDWCQTGIVRAKGLGALVRLYWRHQNGRFGNAVVAGLIQTAPHGREVLPAVLLVLLIIAGSAAVWAFLRPPRAPFTVAMGLATVTIAAVATFVRDGSNSEVLVYQNLLWAPALVTHWLPPIVLLLLAGIAVAGQRLERRKFVGLGVALFLAVLFVSTLTEVTPVLCSALMVIGLVARRTCRRPLGRVDVTLAGGIVAAMCGVAVIAASPGASNRLRVSPMDPRILRQSWQFTLEMFQQAVLRPWLLVVAIAGLMLGAAVAWSDVSPFPAPRWRVGGCFVLGAILVSFGGAFMTSEGDLTGLLHSPLEFTRTWGDFLAATAMAVFAGTTYAGAAVGRCLGDKRAGSGRRPLHYVTTGVALAVVAAVLPWAWATQHALHAVSTPYQVRAARWDAQNKFIEHEVASGRSSVPYRRLPLAALAEPFSARGTPTFAEHCAELYYGVRLTPARRPLRP